ncbi:MAG: carbohydrate ABC transporter permease [Oscillospiraceae bacterium]|jgi:putative aldouronate transport system permease protein|nr:carbohydrate ABC transporter permease [Oscillospiraceae bacterium]
MGSRVELLNQLDSNLGKSNINNLIKDTPARVVFKVFNYIILAIIGIISLAPLWHILMLSFSNPNLIPKAEGLVLWPFGLWPRPIEVDRLGNELVASLAGYKTIFKNQQLIRGYANTIFYVGAGCFLSVVFGALGAYCVSRRALFMPHLVVIMMISMFFSGGMIPLYMVNKALGLVDTRWVIVLNGMVSIFNILILMMAFRNLPEGLEESAQLDGAGHLTYLFKIALPLVKASIAVITLMYAIGKWNEYITAQIYLRNPKLFPLQIILRQILVDTNLPADLASEVNSQAGSQGDLKLIIEYATTIVGTAPLLCIYPFIQKYFVKGIMIGSMKG